MLAVSGTSLESRPQPIIIYDRTFRLLQLYCSVLLSNIIRKWSRLSLVNISVTWLSPALWLVRSQFYWVTLRKWSLLLCLQTRGERWGFPQPLKCSQYRTLTLLWRIEHWKRSPGEVCLSWWMNIPPSLQLLNLYWKSFGAAERRSGSYYSILKCLNILLNIQNRYPRNKTARDILDLEETNKNFCLQRIFGSKIVGEINVLGMIPVCNVPLLLTALQIVVVNSL